MNIKRIALVAGMGAGTGLLLSACAATNSFAAGPIDPEAFGEANRQTYAAMIANPDPQYDEPATASAEAAAEAAERVREGRVKQPERVSTRAVSGPN